MSELEALLNIPQFAERIGVTPACGRRWVSQKRIVSVKLGRCVRIHPEEAINCAHSSFVEVAQWVEVKNGLGTTRRVTRYA